jgi:hypothetical protein
LKSAERAADFVWMGGQSSGQFVGGTVDNPDVLDKVAGTLSLEAYRALFDAAKDSKRLERARAKADYAETYIYIWNVAMPADEDDKLLHWKKGAPTYGVQLIATGHTLVDAYRPSMWIRMRSWRPGPATRITWQSQRFPFTTPRI